MKLIKRIKIANINHFLKIPEFHKLIKKLEFYKYFFLPNVKNIRIRNPDRKNAGIL